MYLIQIRTLGLVAFERNMNSEVGRRYDVPLDSLDIPCIPPQAIVESAKGRLAGEEIGFAHPDGFVGRVSTALTLREQIPVCGQYISDSFLTGRYDARKGYSVRALKSDQVFLAFIAIDDTDRPRIEQALKGIHRLGVYAPEDGITGEVEAALVELKSPMSERPVLLDHCTYASMELEVVTTTPICYSTPFSDKAKTLLYLPGEACRESLMAWMEPTYGLDWDQIICTNAYLSIHGTRLLPTPICDSVVKLDKEQLRYRLSPGKDPKITEQDVGLQGTFGMDFQEHLTRYTVPETKYYLSESGEKFEAMTEGQAFRSTIYGPDDAIRQIAEFLAMYPVAQSGAFIKEGFGEVCVKVLSVREAEIPAEMLSTCFDICCLSDTLILNDRGMPTCRAEDLLAEIEYILGVSGRLRIVDRYTAIQKDYSRNSRWQEDRSVVRCFAMGSILRLETIGGPIDISQLSHSFIGERNQEGYGEIAAWPARGGYYRLAEKLPPARYEIPSPVTYRDFIFGARMITDVINEMLRSRVSSMGRQDREELSADIKAEDIVPMQLLNMMRETYNPVLEEDQLVEWYLEGLTGGMKHESE